MKRKGKTEIVVEEVNNKETAAMRSHRQIKRNVRYQSVTHFHHDTELSPD